MKKSLFLMEWKEIFTNKKILIPIIAILFIPILYAGMFIYSFWDPYAHMDELPVAVVNEDNGASFEGEDLALGDQLTDKLKDLDSFQFHFVSKDQAYKGLDNRDYYMVIEIPENFSQNATTLLDKEPQKLTLKYVPNESYNFLSAQIGETAVEKIKSAVSSELTATYAETIFGKVTEMADGLSTASDGAGKIENGTTQLKDGANEVKDNLEILASKSIEFKNGVSKANAGSGELANGSSELANGLGQLNEAGQKLLSANSELQTGSASLSDGLATADQGLHQLQGQLPALVSGTDRVQAGLLQFQKQLPKELAEGMGTQLQSGVQNMLGGLDTLQSKLSPQLASGIAEQISAQQQQSMQHLKSTLLANGVDEQTANKIIQQQAAASGSKEQLAKSLETGIDQGLGQGFSAYKSEVSSQFSVPNIENQVKAAVDPTFNQLNGGLASIQDGQKKVIDGVDRLTEGADQLNEGATRLSQGEKAYTENFSLFADKLAEASNGATKVAAGSTSLNEGMKQLTDGAQKISDGSNQLANGSGQLADGAGELAGGSKELHDKLGDAADQASKVQTDDDTYSMIGEPVKVDKETVNHVPNYGTGFAPYFLSLGLFVGALLLTIVFPLKKYIGVPKNGLSMFLSKFGVIAIVGVIQALLADWILMSMVGLEVKSLPLFILVSIVTSITFMTLIQLLVTVFADAGRFLAIIVLILQLTTSAGTFPLELIPGGLQPLNAYLPMTYTVQAFKAVISSGDYSFMWHNVGILAIFIVAAMVLTISYFVIKVRKGVVSGEATEQAA